MFPAFAHFRRTATRDTELHGQTIREGEKVVMWYASSNRDETRYEDPDRFDVTRNPEHQAFGAGGRHFCLGTALARLELRILIEETLARYPEMEIDGDAAVRRVAVRQPAEDAAGAPAALTRGPQSSPSSMPTRRWTSTGSRRPLTCTVPSGSACAPGPRASSVSPEIATPPTGAWPSSREATLTASPITVCVRPPAAPSRLTAASPS